MARILIIDDDAAVTWALTKALASAGHRSVVCPDATAGRRYLREQSCDLVMTDVRMPGESGLDLLAWLRTAHPRLPVLVMTAYGDVETAMNAVARGAAEYLIKPLSLNAVLKAVAAWSVDEDIAWRVGPEELSPAPVFAGIGSVSQQLFRAVAIASAATVMDVLVHGHSSSDALDIAAAIHQGGSPGGRPYVLLSSDESQDPAQVRMRWQEALERTCVIDLSVSWTDPAWQEVRRGVAQRHARRSQERSQVGPRIIVLSPSGQSADPLPALSAFDLSCRIDVPSLASRHEDLPRIIHAVAARVARQRQQTIGLTRKALGTLAGRAWPGNLAELESVITGAASIAFDGIIRDRDLSKLSHDPMPVTDFVGSHIASLAEAVVALRTTSLPDVETALRQAVVSCALRETNGNQVQAAGLLGIHRTSLRRIAGFEMPATADGPT